jgi:ABC-2 type transport system permease protein
MRTTNSNLAVFLWTLRRKWKGLAIFIAATATMIFAIVQIYPEISQLQSKAIAEAFGGDIEVSLTQDSKVGGNYTLNWSTYDGVDGYVVVESDEDLPLSLVKGLDVPGVDLRLAATLLPNVGTMSMQVFDAATTQTTLTGLDQKYGEENALVYFGVLAFRGEVSKAIIEGASQTVNTRNMVAEGPFDALLEHPLIKPFVGDVNVDIYSMKGFLCVELFNGLVLYLIIYFLIQYSGAFCCEIEEKTIDVILSTPLTRRGLFISRYLAWATMNLVFIVSWIVLIYLGVLSIGRQADVTLAAIARTMISFLPFLLAVQGLCMLASVVTNQLMKACGISLGLYFGMGILEIVGTLSERFSFLKYASITNYWDYDIIFINGVVPWGNVILLSVVAIVLFLTGLWVFERKDLVS